MPGQWFILVVAGQWFYFSCGRSFFFNLVVVGQLFYFSCGRSVVLF